MLFDEVSPVTQVNKDPSESYNRQKGYSQAHDNGIPHVFTLVEVIVLHLIMFISDFTSMKLPIMNRKAKIARALL